MSYVYLVAGLTILMLCGDALVRGAVALAVRLNIPALIIGLTIVAFGTSAPELIIFIRSAMEGLSGLALGNVVGSNIANIWLVLGVPSLIAALCCDQKFIGRNLLFMAVSTAIFIILCFLGPLTIIHGTILISLLAIFLYDCFARAQDHRNDLEYVEGDAAELIEEAQKASKNANLKIAALLLVGLIGLGIGAELTIIGAVEVARQFGVSEAAIGLTVVAIGTSLPELAATVMAAFRAHPALALGNAIGSNLFNILGVAGIAALITPIEIDPQFLNFDLWIMALATLTIVPFVIFRWRLRWFMGVVFLLAYGVYTYKVVEFGRISGPSSASITIDSRANSFA